MTKSPKIIKINERLNNEKIFRNGTHLNYTKEFSPLSGYEFDYNPLLWNDNKKTKKTHNCYSYALGRINKSLKGKAQPGYASGYNYMKNGEYKCSDFYKRMKKDVPGSYIEQFDKRCRKGFYKIFLTIDPDNDYHWYVQNSNKYFSHKPGSTDVIDYDASHKKIKNPLIANRKYESLNYHVPCFFACIFSDLSVATSEIFDE